MNAPKKTFFNSCPDFLSDEDEEISNWDVNGSGISGHNGAPEIQGKQTGSTR